MSILPNVVKIIRSAPELLFSTFHIATGEKKKKKHLAGCTENNEVTLTV